MLTVSYNFILLTYLLTWLFNSWRSNHGSVVRMKDLLREPGFCSHWDGVGNGTCQYHYSETE